MVHECTKQDLQHMDESGMSLDHKPPKLLHLREWKKGIAVATSGSKGQITIIACANTAGNVIPPMVIFKGKQLNSEWIEGEVPNAL